MGKMSTTKDKSPAQEPFLSVLRAAVKAQELVPGSITVGETASALYAHHRLSTDADQTVADLRTHFDRTLATLEAHREWQGARVDRPVQILGAIDGVQVGFRQLRRTIPTETLILESK
ncbi:MAG: hypothetical protein EBZ48_07175, partial [Proteobacteria bacterium]|nr:hypothetical protein [Pseudomonadota bacterium]